MNVIELMLVDDHPLFRQGLRRVLDMEEDLEVVAEAADGEEALRLAAERKPDVVLMDVNLPAMNGLQATRELQAKFPEIAVIILTAYHDEEQLFHAMRSGAAAYYPKDVTPKDLLYAIRQVSRGNYVIGDRVLNEPQLAAWLLEQFERLAPYAGAPEDVFVPLSAREMEILQYIARGMSNKEVAHALGISRQTVKNHMSSILRKLAVNDRTQAAVYALRRGWIRLQDTTQDVRR